MNGSSTLNKKVAGVARLVKEGSNNPIIQRLAIRIVERTIFGGERSYFEEWKALHDWARIHIDYTPQRLGQDRFQSAPQTLQKQAGDCEDFTILLGSMGSSLGLPYKLRVASPDRIRWLHIYLIGGYPPNRPRSWIPVDASATSKPIGWENVTRYRHWRDFSPKV